MRFDVVVVDSGVGTAAIDAARDNDFPNTKPPPDNRVIERSATGVGGFVYALPNDGAITLKLWAYSLTLARWYAVSAAIACTHDIATYLGMAPAGSKLFVQVTANGGNSKRYGLAISDVKS